MIARIINKCIDQAIWPDALKAAEIVPVYKSGDVHEISNYRPISLISNIAKIFEKAIHGRLLKFLNKHKILNINQFGFQKGINTSNAMDKVLHEIYSSINKNKAVVATFIDLQKAFDTVDHKLLFTKLEKYGIRGLALRLLKSYLTNRTQKVKINDTLSEATTVEIGVPQGSVLGPLLFLIYINDIFVVSTYIYAFADDTVILSMENTWCDAVSLMNEKLNNLSDWFIANKLSLNVKKTELMVFGSYSDSVPQCIQLIIQESVY